MPYLILTSQAKLVNTYVCGPIVVGDKGADAKLMKAVGAKLVTNYPACGSPPLYLVYGNPRTVLEKFENAGYTLISTSVAGDCRECILWTLYSEGGFNDPNNKGIQTSSMEVKRSSKDDRRGSKEDRRGSKSSSKESSKEEPGEPAEDAGESPPVEG